MAVPISSRCGCGIIKPPCPTCKYNDPYCPYYLWLEKCGSCRIYSNYETRDLKNGL